MSFKVPFLQFDYQHKPLKSAFLQAFEQFIDSNYYVLGKKVNEFEQAYAAYHDLPYCVGISNGLDSLHIALKVLGIGEGDEVIVPSNTYVATVLAVSFVGAKPVFVEPEWTTYNIDPDKIPAAITPRTRAIIPVHLYGQPANMSAILDIAKKHNLFVIEDNAQAHGATHHNQKTGTFGHLNATSFYPSKNLGALGDAGALTTSYENYYQHAKTYRNYGSRVRYYNEVIGLNARLDELQAALLLIKLKHLDTWNLERQKLANTYAHYLQPIEEIILPQTAPNNTHVFHLFVIRAKKRDLLMQYLKANGIDTLIHYPVPPHLQACYQSLGYQKGDFPIAEQLADECLSLPLYPGLTEEQIHYVAKNIQQFYTQNV